MKHAILIGALSLLLGACATPVTKTEIVYVSVPIPFIPPPPVVPAFASEVDKLVLSDTKDPGKVGQAYKSDMMQLRSREATYEAIINQYEVASRNYEAISKEFTKLYPPPPGKVAPVTPTVVNPR